MVGVSVIQVANAIRHTPLPPLLPETENGTNSDDLQNLTNNSSIQGGFVGGGQLAWRALGPTVEIIQTSSGLRRAAFRFGKILHKYGARVTSVCGVGRGSVSQVVVGVDLGPDASPQGMVALLSLHTSTLTRAFHFAQKVTSVCMVSGGEVTVDKGTLVAELQTWKGILVVGTGHGTLHVLDLALDLDGNKVLSDEVSPGSLTRVVTPDPCSDQTRRTIIRQGSHPTICLSGSDGTMGSGHFQLMGPDGNVLFEAPSHLAAVTSLAFFPQLASLAVGYGFGSFQIINLSTLTNDCTSPYEANVPPVLSFACQEPENDPKNFVYLWLCRSYNPADSKREIQGESPALSTMYAMSYDKKVWIEGHGLWYQGLTSISPRFEFDAVGGLGLRGQSVNPSLVFCGTSVRHATHFAAVTASVAAAVGSVSALSTPDEDGGLVPEQSLCMFGWVGGVLEQGCTTINHYLAVFDINQWYQAQMPASLKVTEQHLCPYMSFHQLNRVPGGGSGVGVGEVVLAASPKQGSWARLLHTSNDTDWYPAALTYDAHLLTSEGLVEYECPSAQKAALAFLTQQGPSSVVSPEDAYARCVFAGLLPTDPLSSTPNAPSAMVSEREALLNVALDQHQMYFLLQCVVEFAEGHFTSLGCSLPALLDWAWGRVHSIKTANDTLCLPLFDTDCGAVCTEDIKTLHRNVAVLTALTKIITTIRDNAHNNLITLQGANELDSRVQVVCLLRQHLEAVLWFYHCGLLSPSPSDDLPEEQSVGVAFPADLLAHIYHNRRAEIQRLSSALKGDEILMIDGLLEEAGKSGCNNGNVMGQAWKKEGENALYPPPSLHALLSVFLLPDVAITTKHRIVQYLFLDLASLLSDGYVRVVEELVKYPSSFSVSPSLIKLTQGFWLLDHKDFQEALNVLLDPLVNPQDLTPWQHRRIMKAFFFQGEPGLALRYATFRKPPKEDQDDIRLHLTLLLANGLVREAYHYQQTYRGTNIANNLLNHFFNGCEELGKMECVIRLPLSPMEQQALVDYLNASNDPKAHDYLLVYYLLRDKYEQAARLQDKITREGLGINKKRQAARSALVHAYLTYLPHVAAKLSSASETRTNPVSLTYTKPQPLSATIRQAATSEKTKASAIAKTFGTPKQQSQLNPFTPFRNTKRRRTQQAIENSDIGNIFTPKQKPRDASRVVFPTQLDSSQFSFLGKDEGGGRIESNGLLFSPTPAKRKRLSDASLLSTEARSLMNSVIRRCTLGQADISASTSIVSADMLSLLQTPKIKNKRKLTATAAADSSLIDTPQSILKVRQMVQRPHSPSATSDVSVPLFPKLSAKKPSIVVPDDIIASKPCDTSMTPKQLRFHLPKTPGDSHAKKIQMKDQEKMGDEINNDIRSEEEEDWEEREDAEDEVQYDAEAETSRALLKPSLSTPKNPLRNPGSGIPTPRLPLHHGDGGSTHTSPIFPQGNISMDKLDTIEEYLEEQESLELHSRESSNNEMFYSFMEDEDEEERNEKQGRKGLKKLNEFSEESEARDEEMKDIEEENKEIRENENVGITDDESEEVPSAEKSKEVEDSEEDNSLDNQDVKEKENKRQSVPVQGIETGVDSEFEYVNKSQEPISDTPLVSGITSALDKSGEDSSLISEMYEEISKSKAEKINELSVSDTIGKVESHHVTNSGTGIIARKPISGFKMSTKEIVEEFEQVGMKTKKDTTLKKGQDVPVAATEEKNIIEEKDESFLPDKEEEDVFIEREQEGAMLLDKEVVDVIGKEKENDSLLIKEKVKDVLLKNGGEQNIWLEKGIDDFLVKEREEDDSLEKDENVLESLEKNEDDVDGLNSECHREKGQEEESNNLPEFTTAERFSPLRFSDVESEEEEGQEEIVESMKANRVEEVELKMGTTIMESNYSTTEQFSPLRFSDSESEQEEEQNETAEKDKVDIVEGKEDDITRGNVEEYIQNVDNEAKEKFESIDTVSSSTQKQFNVTFQSATPDKSTEETVEQIKPIISPTTHEGSSKKTKQKEAATPKTPARKLRKSTTDTPDKTSRNSEIKDQTPSTPLRRSRRLSGSIVSTPVPSSTAPETLQDSEDTDHSSLTPVRRSRRLSGTVSKTAPGTSQDIEAKDHSFSTPLRRSRRLSESSVASKPEDITSDNEAEDSESAAVTITRSGRKIHQVPIPVVKSRPSTPASVNTTPVRRSRRLSKGNEPSTPAYVKTTPIISQKVTKDHEAVEKVAHRLNLSPVDPKINLVVVLPSVSPDMISSPFESPSVTDKKGKKVVESAGKTTPTKTTTKKQTRKSISDETLETIIEEDSTHLATDTTQKTPKRNTPTKLKNTRSRRSGRKSIGTMETISENNELSPTPVSSSSLHMKVDSGDTASESTETPITPSRRKRRSVTDKDLSNVTQQVKKRGKAKESSVTKLDSEEEIPTSSKRKKITESKSRADSTVSETQSEEENSIKGEALASEASQISPFSTPGRSVRSGSVTSLKESESGEEGTVTERKRVVTSKRQSGLKHGENVKVKSKSKSSGFSPRKKSRRLTVGSSTITTTLEHVPREPYNTLKSLKVYSDHDVSSSSSVATPDLYHRRSKRLKKGKYPTGTPVLLNSEEDEMVLDGGLDTIEDPLVEESDAPQAPEEDEAPPTPETPLRLLDVHTSKKGQTRGRQLRQSILRTSTGKGKRMTFGNTIGRKGRSLKVYSDPLKNEDDVLEPSTSKKSRRSRKSSTKSPNKSVLELETEEESVVKSQKSDIEEEQQIESNENEITGDEDKKAYSDEKTEVKENPMPQFQFASPRFVVSSRKNRELESLTSEAVEFLFSPPHAAGRIAKQESKAKEGALSSSTDSEHDEEPENMDSTSSQRK